MNGSKFGVWVLLGSAAVVLAGCQPGGGSFAPKGAEAISGGAITSAPLDSAGEAALSEGAISEAPARTATSVKLVDRDVEAPDVFQVSDEALWDGRPSLGGVWVASPDAVDPERVILRNPANGTFVIGALFKRERDNPGPSLQISSDAAEALGLLAGQPAVIDVTALRREEVPVDQPLASAPLLDEAEAVPEQSEAAEVAAAAAAAISAAPAPEIPTAPLPDPAAGETSVDAATVTLDFTAPAPEAAPEKAKGRLIQIGIFSVEANANRAVQMLAKAGVTANISTDVLQGKTFWNVTARGDKAALASIKGAGFTDAYMLKR